MPVRHNICGRCPISFQYQHPSFLSSSLTLSLSQTMAEPFTVYYENESTFVERASEWEWDGRREKEMGEVMGMAP